MCFMEEFKNPKTNSTENLSKEEKIELFISKIKENSETLLNDQSAVKLGEYEKYLKVLGSFLDFPMEELEDRTRDAEIRSFKRFVKLVIEKDNFDDLDIIKLKNQIPLFFKL